MTNQSTCSISTILIVLLISLSSNLNDTIRIQPKSHTNHRVGDYRPTQPRQPPDAGVDQELDGVTGLRSRDAETLEDPCSLWFLTRRIQTNPIGNEANCRLQLIVRPRPFTNHGKH